MNKFHTRLLLLQPTPYCNIDCRYCYLPNRANASRMSEEVIRMAAHRLFESGYLKDKAAIVWHSGEPLVVGTKYISRAIDLIHQVAKTNGYPRSTYQFGVQTNATLLNADWLDLFKSQEFRVGISIDGPAFLHDRQRVTRSREGTFDRTYNGLRNAVKAGVHLNVICVLTDYALDYPDEIHDFFANEGVPFVGFNIDEIEGANKYSSFADSKSPVARFTKFIDRMYDLVAQSRAFRVREFDYTQGLILGTQSFAHNEARPFSIVSIDYRGGVSTFSPELHGMASEEFSDFRIGNVLEDRFDQMATSVPFRRMFQEIEIGRERCKAECRYFKVCGGGSCSNKFFEHGTFAATETQFCQLSRQVVADVLLGKMESALTQAET